MQAKRITLDGHHGRHGHVGSNGPISRMYNSNTINLRIPISRMYNYLSINLIFSKGSEVEVAAITTEVATERNLKFIFTGSKEP